MRTALKIALVLAAAGFCLWAAAVPPSAFAASSIPPNLTVATSASNSDLMLIWDTADGGPLKQFTWSNLKVQLSTDLASTWLRPSQNLADLANTSTARTNLGLGTAAQQNTGTSAGTLCLLNAACTWSTTQTFTVAPVFTDASGSRTALGLGTAATQATGTSGATLPFLNGLNTWSGQQQFGSGLMALKGATSGIVKLNAAAVAGNNTITFPAGTTDFSATGGTSQVVKQTSAGAAFTVGQLACADLSDGGQGGCAAKVVTGSLTPTLAYQTAGTSSFAYTTQSGSYVCAAGVVTGWARVVFTPTNGTASGNLFWTNPPYAPATNNANTNAAIGPPMAFAGGWASVSAVYTAVVWNASNAAFANNQGTTTNFLTTANSTTGTSKEMVWEFNYLSSTGLC